MSELALVDHVIHARPPSKPRQAADVFNPATGEVSARLPLDGADEVDLAVAAANDAFRGWAANPPHVRARVLFRLRDLIERDLDRLAATITAEHGKVLSGVEDDDLSLTSDQYASGVAAAPRTDRLSTASEQEIWS